MKNTCGKTRKVNEPYEVWRNDSGWEWRVLKKYQNSEQEVKNEYARWFCFVISPFCPQGELGDVYVREIQSQARKV